MLLSIHTMQNLFAEARGFDADKRPCLWCRFWCTLFKEPFSQTYFGSWCVLPACIWASCSRDGWCSVHIHQRWARVHSLEIYNSVWSEFHLPIFALLRHAIWTLIQKWALRFNENLRCSSMDCRWRHKLFSLWWMVTMFSPPFLNWMMFRLELGCK